MNLPYLLPPLIAAAIGAALLLVTSLKRTRGAAYRTFALLLFCTVLWALLIFAMRSSPNVERALWWERWLTPVGFAIGLFYYHFSLAVTRRQGGTSRLLIAGYIALAGVAALTRTNLFVDRMEVQSYGYAPILNWGMYFVIAVSYLLSLVAIYNLVRAYRSSTEYEERNRLLYLSIAMTLPLAGGVFEVLPTVYPTAIFGNIAFCALASVAVLRYHLFDINVVIRKTVAYGLTSVIVGGAYGAVIFLFGRMLERSTVSPWVVQLSLLIVLGFLLQPVWQRVQGLVDKRFYRNHRDRLQALEDLSGLTATIADTGELASTLLHRVKRALGTSKACLLMPSVESDVFSQVSAEGLDGLDPITLHRRSPLVIWLAHHEGALSWKDMDVIPELAGVWGQERDLLEGWVEFIVPLRSRGNLTAILILGHKLSESVYTREDFRMLQVISNQLAVNLENATLYAMEKARVAQLEKLEDARSGLLLTVAHELKTPITAIKTASSLLEEEEGEHRQRNRARLIQSIRRGADALDKLSSESLDLARLRTASMDFNPGPCDLRQLVEEAVAVIAPAFAGSEQRFVREVPSPLPEAHVDGDRFKQILLNLLSNANKFTPRGGVITLRATLNSSNILFEVCDNGVGIPQQEQALVFQPFHRVRSKSGTETAGAGLGLAMAKSLVELHGGKIWVRSQEGVGSSFFFTIPLERGER